MNTSSFADTKPHYNLLDGLRGVAALSVIWYHIFEGYAFAGGGATIEGINHGYLAVDFFFMLSGFVISYAYDDRWGSGLTVGNFFRRRLIRLHPMVLFGALLGAVTFLAQGAVTWQGTPVATTSVLLALLCACCFIPAWSGAPWEVRGNGEMFPLNGPSWSLFFEYIGNILYALLIRRLSDRALAALTLLTGAGLTFFALADPQQYGTIGVGWTLDGVNFAGGLVRMLFPFTLGMLLARRFHPVKVRGAFWICSAILVALFLVPALPTDTAVSLNGLFEVACIALVFPLLIHLGASGATTDRFSTGLCRLRPHVARGPAALLRQHPAGLCRAEALRRTPEAAPGQEVPAPTGPLTRRRNRKKNSRTLGKVRESFSDGMPSGIRSRPTRTASRRGASRRRRTCPQ